MPSSARSAQVDLSATRYYHCISRCVRRAFLCGNDRYTGKSFDHRKPWLIERLRRVASAFTIDVCAYAVLSNHFHVVLRVALERAMGLSDEAVLRRYAKLFPGAAAEARALPTLARAERVAVLRTRLCDISWFMRAVNEHVARRANKEDECTGRFWEGRFKSQALLDESALLTAMSYVDLNPIRAGIANSLERSDFTSVKQRVQEVGKRRPAKGARPVRLVPFLAERAGRRDMAPALPIRLDDYIELLEWTGRAAGTKPGGRIRGRPPALLARLRITAGPWLHSMRPGGLRVLTVIGRPPNMATEAERRGLKWLRGKRQASLLFRAS